ncbi:Thyroid adenoma-associated protein like protein [Chelonia mydas]|uniref:Thyroid adenoma-associated protein like protein n=1 Tax=Chelonia mydas TaxID=8469 RepID=M7CMU5_CHEMY|nr:Thyroid adenoma-associated protein like protein [Chelonia mydas]
MNPPSMVVHLLQSDFHEVRLLMLEAVLLWWKQVNSKQATVEKRGPLSLLSDLEVTLLRMAMKEKHPECFCKYFVCGLYMQVLEILHCMDLRNVLPRTEDSIKMTPKEFLNWAMNIINASDSIKIQSVALQLASKLVTHLVQSCQEFMESEMRQWVQLVTSCCGDEQQTDIRLAAAEVLRNITPLFLTNQKLILGLSHTLAMWKCVVLLLQSEELIVRDTAADVIRVAQSQSNISNKTGNPIPVSDPHRSLGETHMSNKCRICKSFRSWTKKEQDIRLRALLMDSALTLVLELTRSDSAPSTMASVQSTLPALASDWHRFPFLVLAKKQRKARSGCSPTSHKGKERTGFKTEIDTFMKGMMEDDNLFNKGEVNFWAETLTNVRQLSKHLFLLIPATHLNSPDQGEFLRLARRASDQAKLVTQLLKELPPTPEFSKTVEFTRLAIQNERISTCLKILTLLELDDDACKNKENPEK